MKTRSKLATIATSATLAIGGIAGLATPAQAVPPLATGSTDATFTITGGALSVTVPGSTVALATVAAGSPTASGQLGTVTVADLRGNLVAAWTNSPSSTAFVNGGTSVPATSVAYSTGTATTTSVGTFTPGATTLAVAAPAGVWAGAGSNTVSWNPTVAVTLPLTNQVSGTYTATITHSIA